MAITAVPSNQAAQAAVVRVSTPSANSRSEPASVAQPSAIARISPEGKQRAEQDRQQVAEAALNKQKAVRQVNAVPRPSPIEEATDAAGIAALAIPVPNPNLAPRQLSVAQPAAAVVTGAALTTRRGQQVESATPPPPRLVDVALTPAVNNVATTTPIKPPEALQAINRTAATPAPVQAPVPIQASAPASESQRVASAPVANTAVESAPVRNSIVAQNQTNQTQINRTANEFVAAFQQQNRRSQAQTTEPVSQAPATNTPQPRSNATAVENVARRTEVASARPDTTSFTVGVARNSGVPAQRPGNTAETDASNDTALNARTAVTREEQSQAVPTVSSRATAPAETISQIQANAIVSTQRVQIERQNSSANVDQGGGLAQRLNALANLLTP